MAKWKNNTRGFVISYDNGSTGSVHGPNITLENIEEHADWRKRYYKIVQVEEYFYEDTVRWEIERAQRQIEICQKRIQDLTAELEAAQ